MNTRSGDFKDIRYMPAFVDKTMLIDTILLKKYELVLLTAPRRFGKSVNLSKLKHFLELSPDEKKMEESRKLVINSKKSTTLLNFMALHQKSAKKF